MVPVRLFPPAFRAASAAGTSALEIRIRHPHHSLGNVICLLLEAVLRRTDAEFRLDERVRKRGWTSWAPHLARFQREPRPATVRFLKPVEFHEQARRRRFSVL
jgi:hypothetical protein